MGAEFDSALNFHAPAPKRAYPKDTDNREVTMKKAALSLIFAIILFGASCLSGCNSLPEGYGAIKKAKSLYEELDSARITMTDNRTGDVLMTFCFYINEKDEMIFSYLNSENGESAYSDGNSSSTKPPIANGRRSLPQTKNTFTIYTTESTVTLTRAAVFFSLTRPLLKAPR